MNAALEEYEKSLKLRQQYLTKTDRRIAEAYVPSSIQYKDKKFQFTFLSMNEHTSLLIV
jgi:hypothetical protein